MVANGSVASGSRVVGFPIPCQGSESLWACCRIFHVACMCGLTSKICTGYSFKCEKSFKCALTYDGVCSSRRQLRTLERKLKSNWPLATLLLTDELSQSAPPYKHASSDSKQKTWPRCFGKQERSAWGLGRSNRGIEFMWCCLLRLSKLAELFVF